MSIKNWKGGVRKDSRYKVTIDSRSKDVLRRLSDETGIYASNLGGLALMLGLDVLMNLDLGRIKFQLMIGQKELRPGDAKKVYAYLVRTRGFGGPDMTKLYFRTALDLQPEDSDFWTWQGDRVEAAINQLITEGAVAVEDVDSDILAGVKFKQFKLLDVEVPVRPKRAAARPKGGR